MSQPEEELKSEETQSVDPETAVGATNGEGAGDGKGRPADVPPHPDRVWHLVAATDLSTAYLDYTPGEGEDLPDAREILDYAIALGVPENLLFPEETLARAIQNTINSRIPLKGYSISDDRDAHFEIAVSDDKLKAVLSISKAIGRGAPLDLKKLGAAIRSSGLKGMNFDKIKKDVLAFRHGKELVLEEYPLATGTAAVPGKPREITWEVDFFDASKVDAIKQKDREAPPRNDDEMPSLGEVPVTDVMEMANVRAETLIVSLSPPDAGKSGVDVYGNVISPPEQPPFPVNVFEHLRLGREGIISEIDGILDRWPIGEDGYGIRVRPYRDASATVNISEDGMLASVCLVEGIGSGTHLSQEFVRQELIGAGVIKGIDLEAIEHAVRRAREFGDNSEVVVARGKPPVEPGESRIKFHVPFASGKGVTLRKDGTADFKNQDRITTVSADQLIAEILSDDVESADGWDVRSKVVKGNRAKALPIEIGEGIRKEATEQKECSKLYAVQDGELVYDGKALAVADIHTIKGDVGQTSGNIKFGGSVNITGSVQSGFFVMSKGTIKVAEGVEASLISADESIHVKQGIRGGKKAVIRARKEISAGFIEHATVMAVGDVTIENTCLNSTVKCNGKLALTTDKGRLVGGRVRARYGVAAAQIGSKGGAPTHISFGQDYLISDKIELEEREIEKLQKELVRLEGIIHAAERDKAMADVKRGRARKLQILKLLEKRTERLFWLRERFEQHFPSQIEVRGTIYPGVVLESHGRSLEITLEKKNVVYHFDSESGHIVEKVPVKV